MLSVVLAQLRASAGRMVASCLAVAVGVAFVVAVLSLVASSQRAVLDAVAGRYLSSDAVVTDVVDEAVTDQSATDPQALDRARDLLAGRPEVAAVTADLAVRVDLRVPGRAGRQQVPVRSVTPAGPLRWQRTSSGRLPRSGDEVAVTAGTGASVGDVVTVTPQLLGDLAVPRTPPVPVRVRVVGIVDLGDDPQAGVTGQVFATPERTGAWAAVAQGTAQPVPLRLRVAAAAGTSPEELAAGVRAVLAGDPATAALLVATGEETARAVADSYASDTAGTTAALLALAAVALLVAGLVIANTFAVVLAQRTGELALLRCVGASTAQVLRSVLAEAVVVGLGASAVGAAAGTALAAGATAVLGSADTPVPLGPLVVPVRGVLLGIALGTGTTVLAALLPARAATRVPPLAAVRPLDPVVRAPRSGLLRLRLGGGLLAASGSALLASAAAGQVVPAVASGAVSFLAVVLVGQRAVPSAVSVAGRLAARVGGAPAALAAAGAARHPRRTAATATALLVGVTLTASVVVGAATTRATATAQLDARFPVDLSVTADAPMPLALAGRVAGVGGVAGAAAVLSGAVTRDGQDVAAAGVDPVAAAAALRSPDPARLPHPGAVVVQAAAAGALGITAGDPVTLSGPSGTRTLTARVVPDGAAPLLLDVADLRALDAGATVAEVWASLDAGLEDAAQTAVVDRVTEVAAEAAPTSAVSARVAQRQALARVVDLLLAVTTCLLAVAVLVAVLGVGSTLALSVVERRRESGLLRALGLTRAQLGATLVWEALLVAGVAGVLGCALGVLYGTTGTRAVLAGAGPLHVVVPVLPLCGIVTAAALAGALASVLPARRAARTPPVAALAP